MRPAFVDSLPTRTVPASLGDMGHVVDDRAPAGTVAIDDGAPGMPVQRAMAAELTLRPSRRVGRQVPAGVVAVQRATDAAWAATPEDAPAESVAVGGDLVDNVVGSEPATPVPAEWHVTVPEASTAAEAVPPTEATPEGEASPESSTRYAMNSALPTAAELGAGPAEGGVRSTPVPQAEIRPTLQHAPAAASSALGHVTRSRPDEPNSSANVPSPSDSASDAASGPAAPASLPESAPVSPAGPASVAQRRAGLGAPLPSASVQRSSTEHPIETARSGGDFHESAPLRVVRRALSDHGRDPSRAGNFSAPAPVAEDPRGMPAAGHELRAPLLAVARLLPTVGAGSVPEPTLEAADMRTAGAAGVDELGPLTPTPPAVQRVRDAGGAPDGTSPEGVTPHDVAPTAFSAPDDDGTRPAPPTVQRSVPLVAARRIVPSLVPPTGGAGRIARPSRVVVGRVVAPESPQSSPPPASAQFDSLVTQHPSTPSVAASVARLPVPAAQADADGPTSAAASTVDAARAQWSNASPQPLAARPVALQRLPGLPSLRQPPIDFPSASQLPSRLPSMPQASDLPSTEQLASGAAERASEAADTLRSAAADALPGPAQAAASALQAAATGAAAAPENVEQLARKLYDPLVRRIKAELLLDRERRGIRIDGI